MNPSFGTQNSYTAAPTIEETMTHLVSKQTGIFNIVIEQWHQELVALDHNGGSIYAANGYATAPTVYCFEGIAFPWSIRFVIRSNGEFALADEG